MRSTAAWLLNHRFRCRDLVGVDDQLGYLLAGRCFPRRQLIAGQPVEVVFAGTGKENGAFAGLRTDLVTLFAAEIILK